MNPSYKYRAFGLVILSEFPVLQITEAEKQEPVDVRIVKKDLSEYGIAEVDFQAEESMMMLHVPAVADFRVTNGNCIEVDPDPVCTASHLAVYLMGSCMGAVLHQRGILPLHGSCVTDGSRSILITGDSGAGKSTMASEFLRHGWQLLTDDVSAILNIDDCPLVQSSYPSQKLWPDSLAHYKRDSAQIHSLYEKEDRKKYGVHVEDCFHEGTAPLSMIVRLIPADADTQVGPLEGIAKVDQLFRNTYRRYMIAEKNRQRHFQQCVTLSEKVLMCLAIRRKDADTASDLYELLTGYLEANQSRV